MGSVGTVVVSGGAVGCCGGRVCGSVCGTSCGCGVTGARAPLVTLPRRRRDDVDRRDGACGAADVSGAPVRDDAERDAELAEALGDPPVARALKALRAVTLELIGARVAALGRLARGHERAAREGDRERGEASPILRRLRGACGLGRRRRERARRRTRRGSRFHMRCLPQTRERLTALEATKGPGDDSVPSSRKGQWPTSRLATVTRRVFRDARVRSVACFLSPLAP